MKYIIGITGASGSVYGLRLIEVLKKQGHEVGLVITDSGRKVLEYECGLTAGELGRQADALYDINDTAAPIASGSYKTAAMIIVPCSMKTAACIANGISDNLLTRAADVMMKEGRPLILVPRETPLNAVHLENLLKLSRLGVKIVPAMPGFYHRPETVEDIVNMLVGKICDSLGIDTELFPRWTGLK